MQVNKVLSVTRWRQHVTWSRVDDCNALHSVATYHCASWHKYTGCHWKRTAMKTAYFSLQQNGPVIYHEIFATYPIGLSAR